MSAKRMIKFLLLLAVVLMPYNAFAGGPDGDSNDIVTTTDTGSNQLVYYYDLRNRESYVQVSNTSTSTANIHVQIFRNDFANCQDLNFYDTLTPSDTHIYNMSNIVGNGIPVNAVLNDDSNGLVVITLVEGTTNGTPALSDPILIGNFRIVDDSGYEYRTNAAGVFDTDDMDVVNSDDSDDRGHPRYTFNYNQIGGNNFADIIGFEVEDVGSGFPRVFLGDLEVIPFVYNDAENPTSCDDFVFECGDFDLVGDHLNVGINDIFPSSNGDFTLCQGNQDVNGFVELFLDDELGEEDDEFHGGFVGLNNGNGTGSMDSWIGNNFEICDFLQDDFGGDCED